MGVTAGVSAFLINPELAENKFYIISVILSLFWVATILNCFGMKISAWVSIVGATLGTLLPMSLMIILSIIFYSSGRPLAIEMSWATFFPTDCCYHKLGYFSSILFGLLGLEMVATHAGEMVDPKRDYPKSLFISVVLILSSTILASLAIAVVVPHKELNLVVGVLQAFQVYFDMYNIHYFIYIMAAAIVIGALSGVSAWIIGPTKGIMVASKDGTLPKYLTMQNSHGVPVHALLTQGVIVTILSLFYLYMPSVNSTFIFLSIITSQLAMIVYIALFAASIVLHYRKKDVKRTFKIPGGNIGIWLTACLGITICFLAFIVGFIPPQEVLITNIFVYESMLIGVMVLLSVLPLLFVKYSSKDL
jgi:amino acid transporter